MILHLFIHFSSTQACIICLAALLQQSLSYFYPLFYIYTVLPFIKSFRMSPSYTKLRVMVFFSLMLGTSVFKYKFGTIKLPVKRFLESVKITAVPVATEISERTEFKALQRKSRSREPLHLMCGNLTLRRLRAEQSCWVIRCSLSIYIYAMLDRLSLKLLFHIASILVFCNSAERPTLGQLLSSNSQRDVMIWY